MSKSWDEWVKNTGNEKRLTFNFIKIPLDDSLFKKLKNILKGDENGKEKGKKEGQKDSTTDR